jgi:dCMP deaminase
MKPALVLYVPVLHEGYIKLFEKYRESVDALYLLGEDITAEFFSLGKEIRALDPEIMKGLAASLNIFPAVSVLHKKTVSALKDASIITADDELCRKIVQLYFPKNSVTYEPVFLRWDEKNVKSSIDVKYDRVSEDPFDQKMCAAAAADAEKSSDWWRHVGAVVTKGGEIIFSAHNHHVPSEYTPYAQGDPRDVVAAGTLNLVYTSLHAEQTIVAEAAQKGTSLDGTSMYLNVFPCPLCAKLMAYSGIKKCFFKTGSAWLDAESVLRANGVEIILVK